MVVIGAAYRPPSENYKATIMLFGDLRDFFQIEGRGTKKTKTKKSWLVIFRAFFNISRKKPTVKLVR